MWAGHQQRRGRRGQKAVARSCTEHEARIHHSQRIPVRQSGDWCLTSLSGGLKHVRFREKMKISSTFVGQIKLDRLNSYTLFSCGSRLFPWWLERAKQAQGERTHVEAVSQPLRKSAAQQRRLKVYYCDSYMIDI